jgi:serine/threonine-protein kinase
VARFAREARAAVKIKSEHVARVSDVGTLSNGAPYMVMEYLEGGDLADWLKERGPLSIEQAVEFILQACEAMAEAHAFGIVHRDLKPANLFCIRRADGRLSIKVLDFGISKMTEFGGSGPNAMTHTSAIMGSPLYMSPEQMKSAKEVNAQTDIWAIGVILYELLTGKAAFLAESLPELALRITTEPPQPIRQFRPEIPVALEAVILHCLEKNREQRYPNVAELALALLPFASKRGRGSVERISDVIQAAGLSASALALPPSPKVPEKRPGKMPETVASLGTAPPVSQTTPGARGVSSRRGVIVAVAITSLLAIGAAGAFFARRGAAPHSVASAAATEPPVSATAAAAPPPAPLPSSLLPGPSSDSAVSAAAPVPANAASAAPAPAPSPEATRTTKTRPVAPAIHLEGAAVTRSQAAPAPPRPPAALTPATAGGKANCNPPYVIDSAGNHQYKPECL